MELLLLTIQEIFSNRSPTNASACVPSWVSPRNPTPPSGIPRPSSLTALLPSLPILGGWVGIVLIGWLFQKLQQLISVAYNKLVGLFYIHATLNEEDESYRWMLVWLLKQPSWSRSRHIQISTNSSGVGTSILVGPDEDRVGAVFQVAKNILYLPLIYTHYTIWYKRRMMTISRYKEQRGRRGEFRSTLSIGILSGSFTILKELLYEARQEFDKTQEHSIGIYTSAAGNYWKPSSSQAQRPISSIILEPNIKELLLDDARDFLRNKRWYTERGIPFRRGYLLYGAPGSGKTSLVHAMAGELGLNIYIISLSRSGLDDGALLTIMNTLPESCIVLMEDIDAAFTHGINRDTASTTSIDSASQQSESQKSPSRLSLSGLLNALDGVAAQEGRILIATTNKYSALDPALCRPGRMDIHIKFNNASRYQIEEMFKHFYLPHTFASGSPNEGSGHSVGADTRGDISIKGVAITENDVSLAAPKVGGDIFKVGDGHRLQPDEVAKLASAFAGAIPERECSMASLQGHLMVYKTRPAIAVERVGSWLEKEREARAAQGGDATVSVAPA